MHYSQELFFSLLSPPLIEPVRAEEACSFGFTSSQRLYEKRREEREKKLL
jgi:hypothetical protein